MGIFSKIRNVYRAITGNISVEQEQGYKNWLSEREAETGIKSTYNGKITYASKRENIDVQKRLQSLVNQAEGRNTQEIYSTLQKTSQTYAPYLAKHYQNTPRVGQIQRALSLEKMREEQELHYSYQRNSLQNAINDERISNIERLAMKEKQLALRKLQLKESASAIHRELELKKPKPSFTLRPCGTVFDALGFANA